MVATHQCTEHDRLLIARDLNVGLAYCHLLGVIHRDIAARNVLLSGTNPVRVKLCDFGLGAEADAEVETRFPIAVPWAAPEALSYQFSPASDVWSYAVTLWELYAEGARMYDDWGPASPFGTKNLQLFIDALKSGRVLPRPQLCPVPIYTAMCQCWSFDVANRCSLEQVLDVIEAELMAFEQHEAEVEFSTFEDAGYSEPGAASYVDI